MDKVVSRLKPTRPKDEDILLGVILHIIENEDLLTQFISSAGIDPSHLKANLTNPETQAYALDFILENEQELMVFLEKFTISAEYIWKLRFKLPGAPGGWRSI